MSDPTETDRSDLFLAWRAWVVENLGDDAERASAAAAAAADVADHDGSFAEAVDAARKTWNRASSGGLGEQAGGKATLSTNPSLLAIAALAVGAALWVAPFEMNSSLYRSSSAVPFSLWLASAGAYVAAAVLSGRRWIALTVIAVILAIAAVVWLPIGFILSSSGGFI